MPAAELMASCRDLCRFAEHDVKTPYVYLCDGLFVYGGVPLAQCKHDVCLHAQPTNR